MPTRFLPVYCLFGLGCCAIPLDNLLYDSAESYKSGTPRRVDWATLAESVTIRHFRSEDFPIEQDSTAIWALGQDVRCFVEGDLIDGETPTDSEVIVNVETPSNWPSQAKPMKVFTHGFIDSIKPESGSNLTFFVNAWSKLHEAEYDVLMVDWSPLAQGEWHFPNANYDEAAHNAVDVGRYLGLCLANLANSGKLDVLHLVGHSLGAHAMGKAGRVFNGQHGSLVMRITGLDPAGPRWFPGVVLDAYPDLNNNTISHESAAFVDIIHTNGDLVPSATSLWPALGAAFQLGHMDFYPDGGEWQPGCSDNIVTGHPGCSHGRSIQYYYWSLIDPEYFPSQACNSVEECQDEIFIEGNIARMGEKAFDDYNGVRQLLYNDITDNCWGYTAPPSEDC